MSDGLARPRLLAASDNLDSFDCGTLALNSFLQRHAIQNQQSGTTRTYVAARDNRVVAYYSLAPASIAPLDAPDRLLKGQGRYDVPVILLARLAVDGPEQGNGLGKHMLRDALLRAAQGAGIIGGRALMVHAKNESAESFYLRFGFQPSPTDRLHLWLLMKDLRKVLGTRHR